VIKIVAAEVCDATVALLYSYCPAPKINSFKACFKIAAKVIEFKIAVKRIFFRL